MCGEGGLSRGHGVTIQHPPSLRAHQQSVLPWDINDTKERSKQGELDLSKWFGADISDVVG